MAKLHYKRRDEIEAELNELKSRKCENCNYLNTDLSSTILCELQIQIPDNFGGFPDFTWGCNKWEKKDEITT